MGISTISETVNAIPNLWNFGSGLRKDFINRNGFLYACDFETRLNLDLIDTINMKEINGTENTRAFTELVNSFETKAILAMIAGTDRRNYRRLVKLLKKHWFPLEEPLENEGDNSTAQEIVDNAIENFSFAVRKIEGLKRIATLAGNEATFLNNFYIDRRLSNIKKALIGIRNCLQKVIQETGKCCL